MKISQIEHILRAAKDICQEDEFYIIGSQSLHGKYPDLPDEILMSMEIDLIAKRRPESTELLNNIGIDSPFHESFGYYADPVDMATATLPRDWKNRLVHLKDIPGAEGVKAYCLEPHDLAVAKIAAWREKDRVFLEELLRRGLINPSKVDKLIDKVPSPDSEKDAMKSRFQAMAARIAIEPKGGCPPGPLPSV